jgi:hypothetical protein
MFKKYLERSNVLTEQFVFACEISLLLGDIQILLQPPDAQDNLLTRWLVRI